MSNTTAMTTTCLPPAAYYHINKNQSSVKPRIREEDFGFMDTSVAVSKDWEAAYRLCFGEKSFEEDYPCIEWDSPCRGDAVKFKNAFLVSDQFAFNVMHRLYPFQWRELIPALTFALFTWSQRRECPVPDLDEVHSEIAEATACALLDHSCFGYIATWIKEQQ